MHSSLGAPGHLSDFRFLHSLFQGSCRSCFCSYVFSSYTNTIDKVIDYHIEAGLDQNWISYFLFLTWEDSDIQWWPIDNSSPLSSISFIGITHCHVQGVCLSNEAPLYIECGGDRSINKVSQPRLSMTCADTWKYSASHPWDGHVHFSWWDLGGP